MDGREGRFALLWLVAAVGLPLLMVWRLCRARA
jgi:hypothetical protein